MKQKFNIGDKVVISQKAKSRFNKINTIGTVLEIHENVNGTGRNRYRVKFDDNSFSRYFYSYELEKVTPDNYCYKVGDKVLYIGFNELCKDKVCTIKEIYSNGIYPYSTYYSITNDKCDTLKYVCPNNIKLFKEKTQETISEQDRLIQEAKDFAAEYFKDRNECVGKDWVDNVTDSWIYDSEDFWLKRYHWKYGKDKQPSEEEIKAHWDESFCLFEKQYAELFAERDTELIIKDFIQDRLSACKKALEYITKLEQNSDSVKVRNAKTMLEFICNEDKYLADSYNRFFNDESFMRFIKNITTMKTSK